MGEGLRAHLIVGQAFEDRPGARAREEDRPELGGLIEQMDVEVPAVDPVAEPRLHRRCASGGRAEVEAAAVQGSEETVVDHVAGLIERDEVPRAAGRQIANADGEHPIHQLRCIAPGDQELPQGADVEQPGPVADRADLLLDVAEGGRSRPRTAPLHARAQLEMAIVERGPLLDRLVDPGGQILQRERARGRTRRGACARGGDRVRPRARERSQEPPAHGPLARAHRRRRVALEDLRRAPAFVPRLFEVVEAHVLAQADVAVARHRDRRHFARGFDLTVRRPSAARLGLLERAARDHDLAGAGDLLIRAHPEQCVARRPPEREHQRVARDPLAAARGFDDHRTDPAAPLRCDDGSVVDQHLNAGGPERLRRGAPLVGGGDDDRAAARPDAMPNAQQCGAPREEDARQVVPREDRVCFDGAGRCDHASGLDVQDLVGTDHGDERPLVHADRGVTFEDPCARRRRLLRERLDPCDSTRVPDRRPEPAFLDEHDPRSGGRGFRRGRQPRDPASDDQQIDVHGARRLRACRPAGRQAPDPGRAADHSLGESPHEPRTDEGLRVEAHGQEAVQPIRHVEQVVLGRGPSRLAEDDLAVPRVRGAGAHPRVAVDVQRTVRAIARHAEEAPPPVVLQRAREGSDACAVQRGGNGVARLDGDPSSLEPKGVTHRTGSRPDRSGSSRCRA